jgi:hypothetical protein
MLCYKQTWRGGRLVEANRWFPSTRLCPQCGAVNHAMTLADRVVKCGCGHTVDRDTNAAVNLARWGHTHHDLSRSPDPRQEAGPPMPADETALANTVVLVKPARMTREPTFTPHPRPEPTNAREGRCQTLNRVVRHTL